MKKEDSLIMNGEHLDATRMYLGSDIINHINKIYEDIETETISDVFKELENRSCTNCFFNSSKDKNLELITCDKCLGFVNQRIFKYCGSWEQIAN